jgi:flagellar biosynthesis activator protein FlaF
MYKRIYDEIAEDTSQRIRNNEVHALNHSIALMSKAKSAGDGTRESIEAVFFVSRLWGVLLEDLASKENSLPTELKAKIISIGIWILKYVESVRLGKKKDFQPLIDVSQIILTGLRAKS